MEANPARDNKIDTQNLKIYEQTKKVNYLNI